MMTVFLLHVGRLVVRVAVKKDYGIFWGPTSLVPQPKDLQDMYHHMRWFVGAGSKPSFDRYAYWEKFDYFAVFWGMAIIGGSGLLLWFPETFARCCPGGCSISRCSSTAKSAARVGFIFTIHFFNSHLRPGKVPDGHGDLHRTDLRA
jgi:cytochrome b subunit of formate dehydrogenase